MAPPQRIVLVDAGTLAGWRRTAPSLAQLHQGLLHLYAQHPTEKVAVLADPSLKHKLPNSDQDDFDADIASGLIVCAPAGTIDGAKGWFAAVAAKAKLAGDDIIVVTDQSHDLGRVVALRRDGRRWVFELDP